TDTGHVTGPAGWCLRGGDDELDRGMGGQLRHATGRDQLATTDDPDAVTELLDQFELVAGEHHGNPGVRVFAQHLTHHVDRDRIEAGERFVEDEYGRIVNECRG